MQHGLDVAGDCGSGKSALLGVSATTAQQGAAVSPRKRSMDNMLQPWIEELAQQLDVTTPLKDNASDQEVETTFASRLARFASRRRVLIRIDPLDHFEPTNRDRFMIRLPKLCSKNARLIATAIPSEASEALARQPRFGTPPG